MSRRVACFAMSDRTHLNGVLPVVSELVRAGAVVRFWTDRQFKHEVERVGAEFADIFDPIAIEDVDATSIPMPSRYVTFAAECCGHLAAAARLWGASIVLHDGFALVGRLVAEQLKVPWVSVVPGWSHNAKAARESLVGDPRVSLDPRCIAAVKRLDAEFALSGASPFHFLGDPSPYLNVHKQPSQWLIEEEARMLSPMISFGCLINDDFISYKDRPSRLRVYASFGTIIWRYWSKQALDALAAISAGAALFGEVDLTIGLGGSDVSTRTLAAPNVTVLPYADQIKVLAKSDIFITHQGLNSTHEAVACMTPMLSLPFFGDQPALSYRAMSLGVAMPMAAGLSGRDGSLNSGQVVTALEAAAANYDRMLQSVALAREWESEVIGRRPAAIKVLLAL